MEKNAKFLAGQAERCRRLARQLTDRDLARTLLDLGQEYDREARQWTDARPDMPAMPFPVAH
ncbi:MAG: hypothetical protein JWO25_616 [Alphaproteobacteria bacterium]|nr:hypothetical protein [Alphaproteobacteria bacterium]